MPPFIYHMAEEARWKEAGEEGYFPANFAEEGFTHATKEPHLVLHVANRFLTGVQGNFICLLIDAANLEAEVKFEPAGKLRFTAAELGAKPSASTGGETSGQTAEQAPSSPQQPLFPHIFGPIDSASVVAELAVERSDDGKFVWIEGFGFRKRSIDPAVATAAAATAAASRADSDEKADAAFKRIRAVMLRGGDVEAAARAEMEKTMAESAAATKKLLASESLKGPGAMLEGLERELAVLQAEMGLLEGLGGGGPKL